MNRRALHRITPQLLLITVLSTSASAQMVDSSRTRDLSQSSAASPFLPADSWAVAAARRIDALGLSGNDFAFGDGSLTRYAAGKVLRNAVTMAKREHSDLEPLARMYWERFAREFGATAGALEDLHAPSAKLVEGSAGTGFERQTERLFPVRTTNGRAGLAPFLRPDLSAATVQGGASILAGRHLAVSLQGEYADGELNAGASQVVAGVGKVALWAGRRSPAFGPGANGGLIFSGRAPLSGGGLTLMDPVRLPWALRKLGAIRFEALLARLDSNAAIAHPWIVASHASLSPHPRLLLGLTQTFMFGGEGLPPLTLRNFLSLYGGKRLADRDSSSLANFENGIATAEIRFRPPIHSLPIVLYLEMGTEDTHADLSASAPWRVVPANIVGVSLPRVGNSLPFSLGVEHTYFSGPCVSCSYYATWYRHYMFKDGWTVDRQPIGHALGGEGSEWMAYGGWDDSGGRLRISGNAFRRNRGPYNLYSPTLAGASTGGRITAMFDPRSRLRLSFDGSFERTASGVTQSGILGGLELLF